MQAYVLFLVIWSTLVYNFIAYWVWSNGWLKAMGALDFAGGTPVHICSALA
jgi:Amt family ammonium transporter